MNERIKELMMRSWNTHYDSEINGIQYPITQKFDAEKFAELIVRECARVATQTPCPYDDEDVRKTFGHTWDVACIEAARDIRKHFGVEE